MHTFLVILEFLQKYTPNVERLGFDENFLDVSEMVKQRIDSSNHEFKGHIYKGDCGEGNISLFLLYFLLSSEGNGRQIFDSSY